MTREQPPIPLRKLSHGAKLENRSAVDSILSVKLLVLPLPERRLT